MNLHFWNENNGFSHSLLPFSSLKAPVSTRLSLSLCLATSNFPCLAFVLSLPHFVVSPYISLSKTVFLLLFYIHSSPCWYLGNSQILYTSLCMQSCVLILFFPLWISLYSSTYIWLFVFEFQKWPWVNFAHSLCKVVRFYSLSVYENSVLKHETTHYINTIVNRQSCLCYVK